MYLSVWPRNEFWPFFTFSQGQGKNPNLEWPTSKHYRHKWWLMALFTFQCNHWCRMFSTIKPLGTHPASASFDLSKLNQYMLSFCINMQLRRHLCSATKSNLWFPVWGIVTVYFISSSPGPVISFHAWFLFRWWHFAFHSQPFHKRPRNLVYQKQMAERIENKDFWLNCLGPHIINGKELVKFIVSIRRGQLQWNFLGVFLFKVLILFLTKDLATEHPLRLWIIRWYC